MSRGPGKSALSAVGKRFGRWMVLRLVPRPATAQQVGTWALLRCDCGREKSMYLSPVIHGRVKSCGCLQRDHNVARTSIPHHVAAKRRALMFYRAAAKTRGLSYTLSDQVAWGLMQGHCAYCGSSPSREVRGGGKCHAASPGVMVNGIDRTDSRKGYVPGNCVPCCAVCNSMKLDLTVPEFRAHILKVAAFMQKGTA